MREAASDRAMRAAEALAEDTRAPEANDRIGLRARDRVSAGRSVRDPGPLEGSCLRFHRVKGGLCVELHPDGRQSVIAFQLRDVAGEVAHEASFRRAAT